MMILVYHILLSKWIHILLATTGMFLIIFMEYQPLIQEM